MGRRFARFVPALILAASLLQVASSPVSASSYTYNCSGGSYFSGSLKWFWNHDVTQTSYWIKAVIGDAYIEPVRACTGGGPDSIVPVANIQKWADGSGGYLVQIGYFADSSATPYLFWTPSDSSGGQIVQATWYTNSGRLNLQDYYRFDIYASVDIFNNPIWQYCIKDVSRGEGYTCHSGSRTWGTIGGNVAWWAYEDHYSTSTLGTPGNYPNIELHYMQWLGSYANAPWYVEDHIVCLNQNNPGQFSWYHCNVGTIAYTGDTLNGWTGLH